MMLQADDAAYQSDLAAQLRQQGHRMTPQRLIVLDVIARSGQHLTADEIHAQVQAQHCFTNIATVYRTLQWLQEAGLVSPLIVGSEPIRYEFSGGERHHHLICLGCGAELEVADDVFELLKAQLLKRYGFSAQLQHLGLTGYCASCRSEDNCPAQE